jgi:ATP-dependent Lhr-like helicase
VASPGAMPAVYDLIRRHKLVLVFVNTRLQAEYTFQELWNPRSATCGTR